MISEKRIGFLKINRLVHTLFCSIFRSILKDKINIKIVCKLKSKIHR
jgi:hypothetical protein